MRLTYCFAICLMQIISYAKGDATADTEAPTFVVKVESERVISIKDTDKIPVVVTATYNDGSPVNGVVYFNLTTKQDYDPNEEKTNSFRDIAMVNGRTEYDFNIRDVAYKYEKYNNAEKYIKIVASVSSAKDFQINSDIVEVTVTSNRYNLNRCFSNFSCSHLEPNVEQDVVYQITHVNGSYVNDTQSIVELTYTVSFTFFWVDYDPNIIKYGSPPLTFTGHMNETGFVHFKVTLPALARFMTGFSNFVQKLKYLDEESALTRINTH